MEEKLKHLRLEFIQNLTSIKNPQALDRLEIAYFGRKNGRLTGILHGLKDIPEDARSKVGQYANAIKHEMQSLLKEKRQELTSSEDKREFFDSTLPGIYPPRGHLHLVTLAIEEITEIFERIGFYETRHHEVEWDYYAFESLNMPQQHPARDEWETFFIEGKDGNIYEGPKHFGKMILTPHTSSGQVREMEKRSLPIRMISIGKCYRRQIDISHVPMFHQFDGLLVDRNVTLAHLKGILEYFIHAFFGSERRMRIRPFHFPFTEPSFEVDVSCGVCAGAGCKLCKGGWLELGGAGMVHPNVLKAGGISPNTYSGCAFGWGVERSYMMKEGLHMPDIRILYQNDIRFLEQF